MSKELRTQWHPAIYSAIRLELKDDSAYLDYIREYNLNTKPLGSYSDWKLGRKRRKRIRRFCTAGCNERK